MSRPLGLSELVLIVDNVAASVTFYRDLIGLELERPPTDDWAWFVLSREPHMQRLALHRGTLLFEEFSPKPAGSRFGGTHFALATSSVDGPQIVERLTRAGHTVRGPVRLEWMNATSWYVYDPDGHLAEIWVHDDMPAAEF